MVLCFKSVSLRHGRFGMVFYNNLLTAIMLGALAWWAGDYTTATTAHKLITPGYMIVLLFSGEPRAIAIELSVWC